MSTKSSSSSSFGASEQFPDIATGGSLPIAWQLRDKRVLIVGGGEVAAGRLRSVLEADAFVTLIAPSSKLHTEVRYRIYEDTYSSRRITYHDRTFHLPSTSLSDSAASTAETVSTYYDVDDLEGIDLVLTAIDDVTTSRFIYELAHARHIPTNVADIPPSCDFFFGSQIRSGPLQIMVSTNGKGPKIASIIRKKLEETVDSLVPPPSSIGKAIENVGDLREKLRTRAPEVGGAIGRKRMRWMITICETWSLRELAAMDEAMMARLLDEGWEKNGKVLSYSSAGGSRNVLESAIGQLKAWSTVDHFVHLIAGACIGVVISLSFTSNRR